MKEAYRDRAGRLITGMEQRSETPPGHARVPLTASQHILHLLLTVFTAGLWAPVWIIRAVQGNRVRD